jgi:hypothetical protein
MVDPSGIGKKSSGINVFLNLPGATSVIFKDGVVETFASGATSKKVNVPVKARRKM